MKRDRLIHDAINRVWVLAGLVLLLQAQATVGAQKAENIFLITADGLRWQEVFRGMEEFPITREFGNFGNTNTIRSEFWRETAQARREALLPFLWSVVGKQGQIWGNRDQGSDVRVTNGRNFSYPGYNEFLTGYADPKIDSNDKKLNVNTNVFEWLHGKPAFHGRVAAAVNWDVLPWILNAPRAGFPVWSGWEVPEGTRRMPVPTALTDMVERGRTVWSGVLLDTFVGYAARHAVGALKPRAMYISYGETDDWAHEGHYERYLKAAREFDRFIGELWTLTQSMPEYRGTTTFFITVDHGRGSAPVAWKNHGREIVESAYIWFAVIGPGIAPLGERSHTPPATQAQVAATVAALVGENFRTGVPHCAEPIAELLRSANQ
ncbi:MAG: AP protein [Verrucomicrobiota bacterium]